MLYVKFHIGQTGIYCCLFVMFILEFSASREKIEAPLTLVLAPGASIRENTVCVKCFSWNTKSYKLAIVRVIST